MAPPPPLTPTPHRFLVPKRTGGTQQSGTPKPLAGGSQQFHATPRFSLHSTPRGAASSSTTPAPPPPSTFVQRQQRNNHANDGIHDIIDSSPPQPLPRPSYGGPGRNLQDPIEVDSEPPSSNSLLVPSSQHAIYDAATTTYYYEEDEFIDDAQDDGPSPKRRRLSVLSDDDMEPVIPASSQVAPARSSQGVSDEGSLNNSDEDTEDAEDDEMLSHDDASSDSSLPNIRAFLSTQKHQQQQPKFQPVPRFKAPEPPEPGHREPLPDAFSPRRKGVKYLPGGLASELRDWLMNIETATGSKRDGDWAARLRVDEVRTASNMMLVGGSQQQRQRDTDDDNGGGGSGGLFISKSGDVSSRVILAGEGRLQGLGKKSEIAVGCVVGIARPVWEVDLGSEGQWVVACDWVVLSKPS
ncbi:hypothetical protein PG993_012318 [Apiospora rasikravindrae]|uniref:Uncharacterized protein n=1 Tax=Apiospora rasikravindrae TaxID=990691 RepID=A0ABR1S225_9PEZI